VATVGDLAALPLATLVATVGDASGRHLHALANGIDDRAVVPDQGVKSVGHEETFATDHHDQVALGRELARLADAVGRRLRAHGLAGRTVVLKVRFGDFSTITRSTTLPDVTDSGRVITRSAQALLAAVDVSVGVRLIGVSVAGLMDGGAEQLALGDPADWSEADLHDGPDPGPVRDRRHRPAVTLGDRGIRSKRRGDQQWGPED
jgi:DNA polymerase-4